VGCRSSPRSWVLGVSYVELVACLRSFIEYKSNRGSDNERESLSGSELGMVWDRGMRVGEIVCREGILVGKAVQVWHRGIGDDVGVIGVFLDDDQDVAKTHALAGRRGLGYMSYAAG